MTLLPARPLDDRRSSRTTSAPYDALEGSSVQGHALEKGSPGPRPKPWSITVLLSDLVGLLLASVGAALVRSSLSEFDPPTVSLVRDLADSVPFLGAYIASLAGYGLYGRRLRRIGQNWYIDFGRLLHSLGCAAIMSLALSAGAWHIVGWARLGWIQVTALSLLALITIPALRTVTFWALRRRGYVRSRVLVVGTGPLLERAAQRLRKLPGVDLVGAVSEEPIANGDIHWLGYPSDLPALCTRYSVDRVVVGLGSGDLVEVTDLVRQLPPWVQVSLLSGVAELLTWHSQIEEVDGLALMDIPSAQTSRAHRGAKRAIDIGLSAVGLVALAPVFLAIAAAVRTSRGPVFFRQPRTGQGGRPFRIWKFRTMTMGAEQHQIDLRDCNEADGPLFKIHRDPRVTKVGSFLRRTSLDELPQLFNVLAGQMSLVGPRPLVVDESARFDGWALRRFDVKPGMTGLWQVSGRSDLSFDELRRLDYAYAASWSLKWDLRILSQTPVSVIRGRGAY